MKTEEKCRNISGRKKKKTNNKLEAINKKVVAKEGILKRY